MIRIGIIEDDHNLRNSIEAFISIDDDLILAFSCNSFEKWNEEEALHISEPDILLVDLGLPGLSGIDVITLFKKKYTEARLIVITGDGSPDTIWTAIANGADGYISKPFSLKELKDQINTVRSGGAALSPQVANTVLKQIRNRTEISNEQLKMLTKREKEVVEELVKGFSYKEISHSLNISPSTVNDHLKNIYHKMGVKSKSELIAKILTN
ncbi:response regulator transcription factor [Sediminibacterium sp.]|uniref:LuxR C-terminal-related transcriptional regulator n=1 Tax=Sediminibacterium sp. TaxID=1917865 RepID=UPI0025F09C28|nr:response regulator transcription factor [Sediminibacterium sp.]MBW0176897.1 response regulator transcription factor [Sediminibacterium sp.]